MRGRDPNLLFDAYFDESDALSQLRDLELTQSRVSSEQGGGATHAAASTLSQLTLSDRRGGGGARPKEGQVSLPVPRSVA